MADGTSDAVESVTLEGTAAAWVAERAEELDVDREELLERVVAAYREVEEGNLDADVATSDDVSELAERVDDAEADFEEKLQDVRERVIQVKREADEKASADHDHRDLESDVESLREEVAALDDHVDAGFGNFEEVLSYLRDEADDLNRKTTTLASVVLSMRETVRALAGAEARRARADQLRRDANVAGVENADCEECGQSVTVAQLSAPECPFCGAAFEGVSAKSGWFGSHTLETGTAPALTSKQSWLDDEGDEDSWLDEETEVLEEMAAEDAERPGGEDADAEDEWEASTETATDATPVADGDVETAEVVDVDDPPAEDVTEDATND